MLEKSWIGFEKSVVFPLNQQDYSVLLQMPNRSFWILCMSLNMTSCFMIKFVMCVILPIMPSWYSCMSSCTESSVLQLKLKALILDIIHNISVVKQLSQAEVTSPDAWAWKKQLRFYMGPDKCCYMHMVDAQFSYTYEYQVCCHVATVFVID